MEGLGTGTSLETLLQESRQHTVLLSDLRENSEVSRKTDEKTLSQLQKLQQAATQTLEVAKAHKQQDKDSSITLKAINEANVAANAIIAKRQTSALNTLSKTIDVGLNVVNQKMFSLMEKLGSSLAGAFASVGRSLENKLYGFLGSFSMLVRPIIGVVKLGFTALTKVLAVPLKMIWTGLKAFSNTLIGKLVIFGTMLYLGYKFITGTKLGSMIYDKVKGAIWDFVKAHPLSAVLTGIISGALVYKVFIAPIVQGFSVIRTAIQWLGTKLALSNMGGGFGFGGLKGGVGKVATKTATSTMAKVGGAALAGTAFAGMNKQQLANYINENGGNLNRSQWRSMSKENLMKQAQSMQPATSTVANTAGKASKLAKVGKFVGGKGNIAAMLGGAALDIAADHVENKTASGMLNVGSAALSGAATGAMIGSIIPGIGTAIGAAIGGLIGAGGSLIAGEGGEKIFGSSEEENEMDMLTEMQEQHDQASNAQIESLNDIAEAIRDSNQTLTRVVEKMSTDAQQEINRRESSSTEQARHKDAVEQINKAADANKLLEQIKDALVQLASSMGANTQFGNGATRQIGTAS